MSTTQIVIDTNVTVAGLRSRRGYAFQLLSLVDTGHFEINLSVPLVLEVAAGSVAHRPAPGVEPPDLQTAERSRSR
ncbi:MAG: PIN domain-containing protein [Rhodothermales bacterium]